MKALRSGSFRRFCKSLFRQQNQHKTRNWKAVKEHKEHIDSGIFPLSSPSGLSLWERAALTRWGKYISKVERDALLQAHHLASQPGNALDYGCGEGRWTKMLTEKGWKLVSLDVDPVALDCCRSRNPGAQCHLIGRSNRGLPCADTSMDLVVCVEIISVLESDWFIPETFRVLRPGGLLCGVYFNRRSIRGAFRHFADKANGRVSFYQSAYPQWRKKLLRAGYEMHLEEGICWFPFSRFSNSVFVQPLTRLETWLGLRKLSSFSPWVVFLARKTD